MKWISTMKNKTVQKETRNLILYFVLAYAISWAIAVPLALEKTGLMNPVLPFSAHYFVAYGPLLSAMIVTWLDQGGPGIKELQQAHDNLERSPYLVDCRSLPTHPWICGHPGSESFNREWRFSIKLRRSEFPASLGNGCVGSLAPDIWNWRGNRLAWLCFTASSKKSRRVISHTHFDCSLGAVASAAVLLLVRSCYRNRLVDWSLRRRNRLHLALQQRKWQYSHRGHFSRLLQFHDSFRCWKWHPGCSGKHNCYDLGCSRYHPIQAGQSFKKRKIYYPLIC